MKRAHHPWIIYFIEMTISLLMRCCLFETCIDAMTMMISYLVRMCVWVFFLKISNSLAKRERERDLFSFWQHTFSLSLMFICRAFSFTVATSSLPSSGCMLSVCVYFFLSFERSINVKWMNKMILEKDRNAN